jgi:hypothetical protein
VRGGGTRTFHVTLEEHAPDSWCAPVVILATAAIWKCSSKCRSKNAHPAASRHTMLSTAEDKGPSVRRFELKIHHLGWLALFPRLAEPKKFEEVWIFRSRPPSREVIARDLPDSALCMQATKEGSKTGKTCLRYKPIQSRTNIRYSGVLRVVIQ